MKYWFIINGVQLGPMTEHEAMAQPLTAETPAWHEGLTEWTTVGQIPALAHLVSPSAPVPPAQGAYTPAYAPYSSGIDRPAMPPRPDNYLVWSILVTILCCLVGGIIAIIYSAKVNPAYERGDFAAAQSASNTAKNWCIGSAVAGLIYQIIFLIAYGSVFFAALANM